MKKHRHAINGKPVRYARKRTYLEITPTDVAEGERRSQSDCAAAKAAKRCIPGAIGARVCLGRTYVEFDDHWEMFNTPASLRSELISHDRDGRFEPGNDYYLRPLSPCEIKKAGKAHTLGAPKHGRPGHHRTKPHVVRGVRARGANV
jgi:hypothetical protein